MTEVKEYKTSEASRAYFKKYYQAHKSHYNQLNDAWWKRHPEKLRAKWRRKNLKNPGKVSAIKKRCRKNKIEQYRAKNREWQQRKWRHRQDYMRRYNEKHGERIRQQRRERYFRMKGSGVFEERAFKRRAARAGGKIERAGIANWIGRVKSKKNFVCYWCGNRKPITVLHIDHIIPLISGGSHSLQNLCAACETCNCSKNKREVSKWKRLGQQALSL